MNTATLGAGRVARSTLTLVAESVLRLGLTAVVAFWIARSLGPEQFGMLNFASALMAIFLAAAGLGMDVPVIVRLSRQREAAHILGSAIGLRLVAAVLACAAMALVGLGLHGDDPHALAVVLIVSLALLGYAPSVFDLWFKAEVQAGPPAAARLLVTLLASAAKVGCLTWGWGLIGLAWTVVFEAVAHSVLLWLAWRRVAGARRVAPHFDRAEARALLKESAPYLAATLATVLAMKIDVVLLGALSSHLATGQYSLVQKLSEVLCIVPVALIDSAFPWLVRRAALVPGAASQGQLLFDLAAASAMLAAVAGVLLAAPLIELAFGAAYAQAVPLFQLHAWTCVGIALHTARHRWLATENLQRHSLTLALASAALSIGLNTVLIPVWGAMGAAIAALLAWFVAGMLMSFAIPALREIGVMQCRALWPWARLWRVWQGRLR